MAPPRDSVELVRFRMKGEEFEVTDEVQAVFDRDGCFIVEGLLDKVEIGLVNRIVTENKEYLNHAFEIADGAGRQGRLSLWSHPGHDLLGMVARSEKIAGSSEKLLGGEVYHYHTKLNMKDAKVGGRFIWHQDYGYWYNNGLLRPDVLSTFIAIDRCIKENGCLQVMKGTHHYGRVEHNITGGQQGADKERLEAIRACVPPVYAEMEPGDCLFLHCNVLHGSDENSSDLRRWAIVSAYNRADNDPIYKHHCPNYTPLFKVPNSAIKTCTNFDDLSGKEFMDPKTDATIRATEVETD